MDWTLHDEKVYALNPLPKGSLSGRSSGNDIELGRAVRVRHIAEVFNQ